MATRTYTLPEATRVLPEVRGLVAQVVELTAFLPELQDQVRVAEYKRSRPAAGRDEMDRLEDALASYRSAELELIKAVRALEDLGVRLKDAQIGLVDFLAVRDGEMVELCWKLGEQSIGYWHGIGEGFAGRKPI